MDTLTILRCCHPHLATKTHRMTDERLTTLNFDAGWRFDCHLLPVSNIMELSARLKAIEAIDHIFVIRGTPLPHVIKDKPHPRLKHGPDATYRSPSQGHFYFMVDIDKLQLPSGLQLTPETVQSVIDYVIGLLPEELRDVSFHWQLSSSAGLRDKTKVSIHLWFWSSRKLSDDELKRWGKHVNTQVGFKLIDTALFNDIQPHYTAAPRFEGMSDPFQSRSSLALKDKDVVDLCIPSPEKPVVGTRETADSPYARGKGFNHWLNQIGDHPGGDGFHGPIIRAIASYVASNNKIDFDRDALKAAMRQRILEADASQHETHYVEQKAGDPFLDSAIDGAIRKFSKPSQPRLIEGIEPYYQRKRLSVADAQRRLRSVIRRVVR